MGIFKSYIPLSKKFIVVIVSIIWVSCNSRRTIPPEKDEPIPNTRTQVLTLPNSLGSIEVLLPNRYDTFFKWTHFSDCTGCGWKKYRFQPKALPIFKESGWIWNELSDSVDRFTISHSDYTDTMSWKIKKPDSSLLHHAIEVRHKMLLEMAKSDPQMRYVISDTVQKINGIWFSIIAGESYDSTTKIFLKYVFGTSNIRFNEIAFKFQLLTKNNNSISKSFIENSMKLLKKVKIKNGI
jgi:hypothetical protein